MRRRTIVAVALLAILVLFVGGLVSYSARARSRFERVEARRSTLLYAAPPILLRNPGWAIFGLKSDANNGELVGLAAVQ